MNGLLMLHRLASPRRDGLDPRIERLLEELAMRESAGIVQLPSLNGTVSAGPMARHRTTAFSGSAKFFPGNVVPMSDYRKPAAGAAKASQTKL